MNILGIETSCDETALSLVRASGGLAGPHFELIHSTLFSQIDIHREYGGVFPAIAKREHAKKLVPLLKKLFVEADFEKAISKEVKSAESEKNISDLLSREHDLLKDFLEYIPSIEKPNIDAIAVTYGPGLEPALWVGVNFAKALGAMWDIPVIPTNHMEGHIISPLMHPSKKEIAFPALALLISGGHTELVVVKSWGKYEIVGKTRDDAIGEAFDKAARILGLPYPGGPEISKLAHEARTNKYPKKFELPRPMIHSHDLDFSFSGLKTAVLYKIRDNKDLSHEDKCDLAREFEDAATEVIVSKTQKAIEMYHAQSLIIGGGVIANNHIRAAFTDLAKKNQDDNGNKMHLHIPDKTLATDNAIMIAMAGYISYLHNCHSSDNAFVAQGNLSF